MDGSYLPVLIMAAIGVTGFGMTVVSFVIMRRRGGKGQAIRPVADGLRSLLRRLTVVGGLLCVLFFAGVVLLLVLGRTNAQKHTRESLKQQYAAIADRRDSSQTSSSGAFDPVEHAKAIGYSDDEIQSVPQGVICLGCGNPIAVAGLKEGETVVDLGSGAGFDAFLAARKVGPKGKVIGVDMTAEMVAKATESARKGNCQNVLFKVGEIEHLPLEDDSIDVAISNCVVNHCPDKLAAFKEIRRCLKPKGRIVIADLVVVGTFPAEVLEDKTWGKWLAVASEKQEYLEAVGKAGFKGIAVVSERASPTAQKNERLRGRIISIVVKACK